MGYLYKLIKTMQEHHVFDEAPTTPDAVNYKHLSPDDQMKALSEIEDEVMKSLSEDQVNEKQQVEAFSKTKEP